MSQAPLDLRPEDAPHAWFVQVLFDLEAAAGVALTLHDLQGVFYGPDGENLIPNRNLHLHPYCFAGRSMPNFNARCVKHCMHGLHDLIAQTCRVLTPTCWKGVREVVVPVVRGEEVVAILYAGAFRDPAFPPGNDLGPALLAKYAELPLWNDELAGRLARLLTVAGHGLLALADRLHQDPAEDQSRRAVIRRFIYYGAHRPLRLADLADHLGLSITRTSHLVHEELGASFQELLLRERMVRARQLLLSTGDSLETIARHVGLGNVYYFSRQFRRFHGEPPGQMRKKHREA